MKYYRSSLKAAYYQCWNMCIQNVNSTIIAQFWCNTNLLQTYASICGFYLFSKAEHLGRVNKCWSIKWSKSSEKPLQGCNLIKPIKKTIKNWINVFYWCDICRCQSTLLSLKSNLCLTLTLLSIELCLCLCVCFTTGMKRTWRMQRIWE